MRVPRRDGFTLIELLVVIAIISVLVGLLLPAVQRVREATFRARCLSNLKQLALAAHQYHDSNGRLPGAVEVPNPGGRFTSLFVELLPFVEQGAVYSEWDFVNVGNNYSGTPSRAGTVIKTYICPSSPVLTNPPSGLSFGLTTYAGNGGTKAYPANQATCDGMFHTTGAKSEPNPNQGAVRLTDAGDGTTNTILFGERMAEDGGLDSFLNPLCPISPTPNPKIQSFTAYLAWAPMPVVPDPANAVGGVVLTGEMSIGYSNPTNWTPPPPPTMENPVPPPPMPVSWTTLGPLWWKRLGAYGSNHTPTGACVAFADGSSRFLSANLAPGTMGSLSTRNGGEPLPDLDQ